MSHVNKEIVFEIFSIARTNGLTDLTPLLVMVKLSKMDLS